MARTIVCTECGKTVPYGRLSCAACGALLASVTGGVRQVNAAVAPEPAALSAASVEATPIPASIATAAVATEAPRSPKTPAYMPRPRATTSPVVLEPSTVVRSPTPGAFVPAEETNGHHAADAPSAAAATAAAMPLPAWDATASTDDRTAAASEPDAPEDASSPGGFALPAFHLDRLDRGLDWAAAIGSGLIALGMLLPWSRTVIGSGRVDGYLGAWGLAGPWHVLFLVWALVVLGLSLVPTVVPAWLRTGVAGFALGVFVLGISWPYVIGPLGGQVGILSLVVGALVLIGTGVLTIWRGRHDPEGSAV